VVWEGRREAFPYPDFTKNLDDVAVLTSFDFLRGCDVKSLDKMDIRDVADWRRG
jgi:hypothetical protein